MLRHFPSAEAHDRWTLVFTFVIAFSTFFYMTFAGWTLIDSQQQTKLLHQQTAGIFGAIVRADFTDRIWPESGDVSVIFTNEGKVPAKTVVGTIILTRQDFQSGKLIPHSETKFPISIPVLNIGEPAGIPQTAALFGVIPNDKTLYLDKKIAIAIAVTFQYNDGFDDVLLGADQCYVAYIRDNPSSNRPRCDEREWSLKNK